MKKLISLLLCLMMLAIAGFACAEGFEALYAGTWKQIENGPKFYIPDFFCDIEISAEDAETGLIYLAATEDEAYTCQIYWMLLDAPKEIEELLADIQTVYPESQLIALENAAFVCYADMDKDVLGFAALSAVEQGMYQFLFTPASDENMVVVASAIVASMVE